MIRAVYHRTRPGYHRTTGHARKASVVVTNGAVLFHHPSAMQWLILDNPHARVRLPGGLLPTTH
jgi:hypothetical protein